jgi:hypothetical protein
MPIHMIFVVAKLLRHSSINKQRFDMRLLSLAVFGLVAARSTIDFIQLVIIHRLNSDSY